MTHANPTQGSFRAEVGWHQLKEWHPSEGKRRTELRLIVFFPHVSTIGPHKAVAEVSKIGSYRRGLVVVTSGWQSEPAHAATRG